MGSREVLERIRAVNEPTIHRMPIDWNLLRQQGTEWLRCWDTQIRGRGRGK